MSEWSRRLKLEHSESPIGLDLKELTVVAYRESGKIPMSEMGSGENWVGYHIVSHLALHQWFVQKNRPVPSFLMLDQPTQVYYPPDMRNSADLTLQDIPKDEDRQAVVRLFSLIFEIVEALSPKFQVIITDHADLTDEWFQHGVVQRWRNGVRLIPSSWY